MRFPGGFYDLMTRKFDIGGYTGQQADLSHGAVVIAIAFFAFVPFLLWGRVPWVAGIPAILGFFEAVIHVVGIRIHNLPRPYSPGMATALVELGAVLDNIDDVAFRYGVKLLWWLQKGLCFLQQTRNSDGYEKREARLSMNTFAWMENLAEKLQEAFGHRIMFIGLQGSRARGEAQDGSDIDVVVLLDSLNAEDLGVYRGVIKTMPRSDLACGFVGSADVLALWPRHELFQFYNDTVPIFGQLPEIAPFTESDAMEAARIAASGIYHAACHAFTFDGEEASSILKQLFKGAFFALQALHFSRTGAYISTKAELAELLDGDEALILEVGRNWELHSPSDEADLVELVNLLIRWAGGVMCSTSMG